MREVLQMLANYAFALQITEANLSNHELPITAANAKVCIHRA